MLRTSKTGLICILCVKTVGKLELLDMTIKKLKRGKGSPDGCVAEVCHALPPSARKVLLTGLQDHFDTLSFPSEWTETSATLIPKCVGPQGLKDCRPLASLSAIRKLLGNVWMLSLPRELPWRSFQAAFLPGRDAVKAAILVQRCCEGALSFLCSSEPSRPNTQPSATLSWQREYLCMCQC